MSGSWYTKEDVLKDLEEVTGSKVSDIDDAYVVIGECPPPPARCNNDDTEEEFYTEYCGGDPGVQVAPDLSSIKSMLDEVCRYTPEYKNERKHDDKEKNDQFIVISKLNPMATEFTSRQTCPNADTNVTQQNVKKSKKHKRERNAAVASILQGNAANENMIATVSMSNEEPMKLLKPADFITEESKKDENSTEKLSNKPSTQTHKVVLSPTQMFKKKSVTTVVKKQSVENTPSIVIAPAANGFTQYTPSTLAEEYYKDFEDRAKVRQSLREDIWTRAEKQMKEIESKRRMEGTSSSSNSPPLPSGLLVQRLTAEEQKRVAVILLPQHRHQLTGECVVCKVIGNYS